jgi:hypothetical protein
MQKILISIFTTLTVFKGDLEEQEAIDEKHLIETLDEQLGEECESKSFGMFFVCFVVYFSLNFRVSISSFKFTSFDK